MKPAEIYALAEIWASRSVVRRLVSNPRPTHSGHLLAAAEKSVRGGLSLMDVLYERADGLKPNGGVVDPVIAVVDPARRVAAG